MSYHAAEVLALLYDEKQREALERTTKMETKQDRKFYLGMASAWAQAAQMARDLPNPTGG